MTIIEKIRPAGAVAARHGESAGACARASTLPNPAARIVDVRDLRKTYGSGEHANHAVRGIDLAVHAGEIVGVLGPNGAGKTTTISIIEGLVPPDAGSVRVFGEAITARGAPERMRARIGVSMQNSVLPPLLTVRELLDFKALLHPAPMAAEALLERLGLAEKAQTQFRHLSGGQQQRLVLAMALVGNPDLLFLDEPTSQLDPQGRRAVWDLLIEQRQRHNAGMLVTTHQMEEAERLCDRVLIIDRGKIIAEGAPRALISTHCPERTLEFLTRPGTDLAFLGEIAAGEPDAAGMCAVRARPANVEAALAELIARQTRGALVCEDMRISIQTLEDVFLKLTGRGIRS